MKTMSAREAKNGFGLMIGTARMGPLTSQALNHPLQIAPATIIIAKFAAKRRHKYCHRSASDVRFTRCPGAARTP